MPRGGVVQGRRVFWFSTICAIISSACMATTPNHSLTPGHIAAGEGGLFGHVEVYNRAEDVTENCSVVFSDERGDEKRVVSLKESEWVFITMKAGPIYISRFGCLLKGGIANHAAQYETRRLRFDVTGGDRIAYFGHVTVN